MQRDASYYYELIAQAAARGEEAPEDLINGLTLAHLEHLKTFIGQSELQLPEGFLVGVDPRSIEWANASTAYRERYERQVYLAATYLGGEGFTFLLEVALGEPPTGKDFMHWEYARINAAWFLSYTICLLPEPEKAVQQVLDRLGALSQLSLGLVSGLIRGFDVLPPQLPVPQLQALRTWAEKAGAAGHGDVTWEFAQVFRRTAPEMVVEIARERLQALGTQPVVATHLDELKELLSFQQFFPESEFLKASLEQTAATWMTNPYYQDGLYLFVALWKEPLYQDFVAHLGDHLPALHRITEGLPAEPSLERQQVDPIDVLRAHQLLYKLVEDPSPHWNYLQKLMATLSSEEQAYLRNWLED